jgi:hypothetical protein
MIVLAMAHCQSWFLTQTCLQSLRNSATGLPGEELKIVVVDNSWDFSPSIRGVLESTLGEGVEVLNNPLPVRSHGSALDLALERYQPDFLFTWETDITANSHDWLKAYWEMLKPGDFMVGPWHPLEQYCYMSAALYRGEVLQKIVEWSKKNASRELRWGMKFEKTGWMADHEWAGLSTPFGERRGWPEGTELKLASRMQDRGPGWYEPGHIVFHWGVNEGYTYSVMPTTTEYGGHDGTIPAGTFYGPRERSWCVHWYCGTRALTTMFVPDDNPDWTDGWLPRNREWLLRREARQWLQSVPKDVQEKTLALIREYGWRSGGEVTPRNRQAVEEAERIYRSEGIPL